MSRAFREYDMYPYVERRLKQYFKRSSGWKIIPQYQGSGYRPDFIVIRNRRGISERVVVEVKSDCYIKPEYIVQLNSYASKIAGPFVKVIRKILVIPSRAKINRKAKYLIDKSRIKVVRLRKFKC